MDPVTVVRSSLELRPDPRRLITKSYLPGGMIDGESRIERLIGRILALPDDEAETTLAGLRKSFGERHPDLDEIFKRGFSAVAHAVPGSHGLSSEMRQLIGAYFVHEYSLEASALTNPSIVAAPDQSGVPEGFLRVVVSLRSVGEGHLSSIEFRTGLVGPAGDIELDAALPLMPGSRRSPMFAKQVFTTKLDEMGVADQVTARALARLSDRFTMAELDEVLASLAAPEMASEAVQHTRHLLHWLASSNYEVTFPEDSALSQRVLFPDSPAESRGMEDARFVRFVDTDGSATYLATYTAYDGLTILPQLIETADFTTFRIATLNGNAARNKGIALFPRRLNGHYVALARGDGEGNQIMWSDRLRFWDHAEHIQAPSRPWELMQIGNAGSPIETDSGWLVVTHGVGPMRQYALGAILLDIDDPGEVIGHLRDPILVPDETERHGYVPNVVYSCGSLVHAGRLVIAYGASDTSTKFASLEVDSLLDRLTRLDRASRHSSRIRR